MGGWQPTTRSGRRCVVCCRGAPCGRLIVSEELCPCFWCESLLIVVTAAGLSQPAEAEVRRLILAAGANNGGVDRELLRYAVSDAEQFVEVLQEMGGLGSS